MIMLEMVILYLKLPLTVCFLAAAVLMCVLMVLASRRGKVKWKHVFFLELAAAVAAGICAAVYGGEAGFHHFGEGMVSGVFLGVFMLLLILSWVIWRAQEE
jgi:hypothetical protein